MLCADCESHAKHTRELEVRLKWVSMEIEPVKEKFWTSQAELEASNAYTLHLEEDGKNIMHNF